MDIDKLNSNRRHFLVMTSSVSALLLTGCEFNNKDHCEVTPKYQRNVYVLVHGAWHGGWCWRDVASKIRSKGHAVYTPTMTGLGERVHLLNKETDLNTHIKDILNVVKFEKLSNIVLVGHSYGGMIITGVADALKKMNIPIKHVVYLDAAIPENGQSMLTVGAKKTAQEIANVKQKILALSDDNTVMKAFSPSVFGIPPDHKSYAWVESNLTPHPVKSWLDSIKLENNGAKGIPSTYIHCTSPVLPNTSFPYFANKIRKDSKWNYIELKTGHNAMVTEPERVSEILLNII